MAEEISISKDDLGRRLRADAGIHVASGTGALMITDFSLEIQICRNTIGVFRQGR
jgi:hypothetical protein